jgi:hypothetical protein
MAEGTGHLYIECEYHLARDFDETVEEIERGLARQGFTSIRITESVA